MSKGQVPSFIIGCVAGQLSVYAWDRGIGSGDPMLKLLLLGYGRKEGCLQLVGYKSVTRVTCIHTISMAYSEGE